MKRDPWNRCCECGKFISYKDFEEGKADTVFVTPSSLFTDERIDVYCAKHKPKEKQND